MPDCLDRVAAPGRPRLTFRGLCLGTLVAGAVIPAVFSLVYYKHKRLERGGGLET